MSEENLKVMVIDPLSTLYEWVERGMRLWFVMVNENFHRERQVLMTVA